MLLHWYYKRVHFEFVVLIIIKNDIHRLYSDRNYSDIENWLLFHIPKDAKLYANERVLPETEIYKTERPL